MPAFRTDAVLLNVLQKYSGYRLRSIWAETSIGEGATLGAPMDDVLHQLASCHRQAWQ